MFRRTRADEIQKPQGTWQKPGEIQQPKGPWQVGRVWGPPSVQTAYLAGYWAWPQA